MNDGMNVHWRGRYVRHVVNVKHYLRRLIFDPANLYYWQVCRSYIHVFK